jgi:hypothetical protein
MGWTATAANAADPALTWEEWRARQQRSLVRAKRQHVETTLSERELARLSFVRWLHQRDDLDSRLI